MITCRWCPYCGAENLPQRRFCRSCGTSLEFRCPNCAFINRIGDKWCGGCGESLLDESGAPVAAWQADFAAAREAAAQLRPYLVPEPLVGLEGSFAPTAILESENRMATIVKADLSGFTAMSELLNDAEETTNIMNQVFAPLVDCVRRYGGHVDNFAGDMVIAFFGAPHAVEMGPERAVRCALEMRTEVERLNAREISHGVELGISTGIAGGYALWGEVGFGQHTKPTLIGELGDYAALLEKHADRGTVGICPDTYLRVKPVVPCEEQNDTVTPPGETVALPVYYAETPGQRSRWLDALNEDYPPLVGRGSIWRALVDAWSNAQAGVGGLILLHGEAGCGKTRLLVELAHTVAEGGDERIFAATGRPLSEVLGDDFGRDLRRAVLAAEGIDAEDTEARTSWLGSLGVSPRNRDVAAWIAASAEQQHCLVILDGLDWVPEVVPRLVESLSASKALVVLASRDPSIIAGANLGGALRPIAVPRLERDEVLELAAHLIGSEPEPALANWLCRWSDGNPLYVTQWLEWLDRYGQEERFDYAAEPRSVPWRLQELADVALDALGDEQRAVLYAAASAADAETLEFEAGLVGYLVDTPQWSRALHDLQAAGLLAAAAGTERLAFAKRVVWLVARRRLSDSTRQALVERVAAGHEVLEGAEV